MRDEKQHQHLRTRVRVRNERWNAGEFKIVNGVRVRIGDAPRVLKTSEFIGVFWRQPKWQAVFNDPDTGVELSLGFFDDELCAASAYNRHVRGLIHHGATRKFRLNKLRELFEQRQANGEESPCPSR